MSCYLCETCANRRGYPDSYRVCWYKYADCSIHGAVRMPVMGGAVECARDLCADYEAKEADCERADSVEQIARDWYAWCLQFGLDPEPFFDRLHALGVVV